MKTKHFTTIEFLTDFATRKEGERLACDGMLASQLIREGVAKKVEDGDGVITTSPPTDLVKPHKKNNQK